MANFRGIGIEMHTEYNVEGSWQFETGHSGKPCFHATYDYVSDHSESEIDLTYHIRLYKGYEFATAEGHRWNNNCPFDKDFITNHLRQLNDLFPIGFSIDEKFNHFVVNMHIKDAPPTFHKYAMSWVRYLYEYPFNMMTIDVYRLLQEEAFADINVHSMYAFLFASLPDKFKHPHGQQIMLDRKCQILDIDTIKQRLKDYDLVNDIFPSLGSKSFLIPAEKDGYQASDSEYWENEEFYKITRLPIYIKLIPKLKK